MLYLCYLYIIPNIAISTNVLLEISTQYIPCSFNHSYILLAASYHYRSADKLNSSTLFTATWTEI